MSLSVYIDRIIKDIQEGKSKLDSHESLDELEMKVNSLVEQGINTEEDRIRFYEKFSERREVVDRILNGDESKHFSISGILENERKYITDNLFVEVDEILVEKLEDGSQRMNEPTILIGSQRIPLNVYCNEVKG